MKYPVLSIEKTQTDKLMIQIPVQSPALCDLADKYNYNNYRADYRDETFYTNGLMFAIFDTNKSRLEKFLVAAQPLVNSACENIETETRNRENERELEITQCAAEISEHQKRVENDKKNLSRLNEFTGGENIVFNTINNDGFWLGKIGTCYCIDDVSPDALRARNRPSCYFIADNTDPIPGNSNHSIKRYFGWRGTTNDKSCTGRGVRMVYKIVKYKFYTRIYLSKFHPDYTDYQLIMARGETKRGIV